MFFLGIGKDPLNGFLAFGIKLFVFRGVSGVIGQFFVVFPNMAQDSFKEPLIKSPCRKKM